MLEQVAPIYSKLPIPAEGVEFGDHKLAAADVETLLSPILTDERKDRIEHVLSNRTHNFVPVLEHIFDRGNVNAVMRSAEAFGFYNFHIIEKEQATYKESNRITKGTHKWLDINVSSSTKETITHLKDRGYKVYCTDLESARPLDQIDFSQPTALVFGNERDGVSAEMKDLSDGNCILPMQGFAQSFNISVAAAICFYHVYQQRMSSLGQSGDLTKDEKIWLRANYYLKTFGDIEKLEKLVTKN